MNHDQLLEASALFIPALLGHLIGDYLLQPKWMALTKFEAGTKGVGACSLHALLYTTAVCGMLGAWNIKVAFAVALPHWIIDHWSLAESWLKLIRGRTGHAAYHSEEPMRIFNIAFYALVYAVVDNTFHLLSLWLVIILFLI